MKIRNVGLVWLLSMLFVSVSAQQYRTGLPYRMVGGKMIVEMKLNGMLRSFIFDTGAGRTLLTDRFCNELNLSETDSMAVTDANGQKSFYPIVAVRSIQTPDEKFEFKNVSVMKYVEPEALGCFRVDGLIGSDLLAGFIVEIDGKTGRIILTSAEREPGVSFRKMVSFTQKGLPVIPVQTGTGHVMTCLFDTGSPSFLTLKDTDFESLKATSALEVVSEGVRVGDVSLGGVAETAKEYRVVWPVLTIASAKFRNVTAETSTPPYTLLGVKLLDYGRVVLDYSRGRFYFDPYEVDYDLSSHSNDIGLQVKDGELVVASVWKSMEGEVEMGDKITKINGKPVGKYDFCESMINGIPELKAKKKNKLTIQTRKGEKVVVFTK